MKTATHYFTDAEKQQIDQAVRDAESKTSAEIIPAVATASGRYDRPEDIVGLWLGGLGVVVAWLLLPEPARDPGAWGGWPGWANLVVMLAVLLVGFILGALLASRIAWLRRLFTGRNEMTDDVADRAEQIFATSGVFRTQNATGLLIYLSLYERMAVIRADATVTEKLGQGNLDELRDGLIHELKTASPTEAICKTLSQAGEKLSSVLPKPQGNPDELPNQLVIID